MKKLTLFMIIGFLAMNVMATEPASSETNPTQPQTQSPTKVENPKSAKKAKKEKERKHKQSYHKKLIDKSHS